MLATRNFSSKYDAQGKYLRPSSALYIDHDRQYFFLYLPLKLYVPVSLCLYEYIPPTTRATE